MFPSLHTLCCFVLTAAGTAGDLVKEQKKDIKTQDRNKTQMECETFFRVKDTRFRILVN